MPHYKKSAFTLVELLTVIAIIGVLAAILIPTVGRVRESSQVTKTISNLRQLYTANKMHAAEYKGLYVPVIARTLQGNGTTNPAHWYENPVFGAFLGNGEMNSFADLNLVTHTGKPNANPQANGQNRPSLAPSNGSNSFPRNFCLRDSEVDQIAPRMILFGDCGSAYWLSRDAMAAVPENWQDVVGETTAGGLAFRYSGKATVVLANGSVTRVTKAEVNDPANFRPYFPDTGDTSTATRLMRNTPPY